MIINTNNTTVVYRCPECGSEIFSIVGIFALSGDMIKLSCKECGSSSLTVSKSADGKMRFTVPCIACPKPHNYTVNTGAFTSDKKGALCLPCPYTGIDICFIGDKQSVMSSLSASDKAITEMMEQANITDLHAIRTSEDDYDEAESDPMIEDIVSFVLSDLNAEGAIHCKCSAGMGKYSYKFYKENLVVYCENCKTAREMRMAGVEDANRFLETTELYLY